MDTSLRLLNLSKVPIKKNHNINDNISNTNSPQLLNSSNRLILPKKKLQNNTNNSLKSCELIICDNIIHCKYKDDLNLIELNHIILKLLEDLSISEEKKLIDIIDIERSKISQIQTRVERAYSLNLIKQSEKRLSLIRSKDSILKYKNQVDSILKQYSKIGPLKKISVFGGGEIIHTNDPNTKIREDLVESFLLIANEYVSINIIKLDNKLDEITCLNCGFIINLIKHINEDTIVCENCSVDTPQMIKSFDDSKTSSNVVTIDKKKYRDLKNFESAIDRYMGICNNSKMPDDLDSFLDPHFTTIGYPSGSIVRQNPDIYSSTLTRELMISTLKLKGASDLYSDINYIINIYWGRKLNDISHLKQTLIDDYQLSQPLYEKYKNPNKSSSMNVQYRLWRHLRRLNFPCTKSEFQIPISSFDYYENIWEKICKDLSTHGWVYVKNEK